MPKRVEAATQEGKRFINTRLEIAKQTLREIEKGIRSDATILLELEFPPSMSEAFEMKRRSAIKKNRREFLNSVLPRIKEFSQKTIF